MTREPGTTAPDLSRNAIIALAEFHEDIAKRQPADIALFYRDTAATLRALADERIYPQGDL